MKSILKFKKSIILLVSVCCFFPLYSQVSVGKYTVFPNNKLLGLDWKPRLTVIMMDNDYYLGLCVIQPNNYASFSDDSRLLIKFSDTITYKCEFLPQYEVTKDYDVSVSQYGTTHRYYTFTIYELSDEMLARIRRGELITKIRIVFDNGDVKDYDIDSKYQMKFIKGIQESLQTSTTSNAIRKSNMDDSDF